VFYLLWFF